MTIVPVPPSGQTTSGSRDVSVELPGARPVRLLLVDEQRMFTDALLHRLAAEPDLEPIGTATEIAGALSADLGARPDVVLVDLPLGEKGRVDGIRDLRRSWPETSVIVVTDDAEPSAIGAAIDAGALGFILKRREVGELVRLIRQASRGEMALTIADAVDVGRRLRDDRDSESEARRLFDRLTERESQILVQIANGRSTGEIAAALHISPLTVRSHVKSVLAKLEVHSRVEAVAYALRNGLLETDRSA